MTTNTAPDQLFGNEVMTQDGKKLGSVDNVWVDDSTNQPEFIGVKTGFFMGHTHIIPLADANTSDGAVTVPYDQDMVKNAPHFAGDQELSPSDEDNIYQYYNLDRSTNQSPTGLGTDDNTGGAMNDTSYQRDTGDFNDNAGRSSGMNNTEIDTAAEELVVGKRTEQAGNVRLRKVVRTENKEVPVELRREEVDIERIPAGQTNVGDSYDFQEQEIDVPVSREEAVVGKEVRSTGGVRVNKTSQTETQNVSGEVRSEEVEVDDSSLNQGTTDRNRNTNT